MTSKDPRESAADDFDRFCYYMLRYDRLTASQIASRIEVDSGEAHTPDAILEAARRHVELYPAETPVDKLLEQLPRQLPRRRPKPIEKEKNGSVIKVDFSNKPQTNPSVPERRDIDF